MIKRKKIILIAGVAVALLGIGGGAAIWWMQRTTPEELLYQSIAQESVEGDTFATEESTNPEAGEVTFEAFFKKDGTIKSQGTLKCSAASAEYGRTDVTVTIMQINESTFMRYDSLVYSEGEDKEFEAESNKQFQDKLIGKWILVDDKDPTYLGYKEYGVLFGGVSAVSKKMSGQQIIEKMKEHKVVTILNSRDASLGSRAATEYDVLIRRSAYEKFIDSVEPRFKYKDATLDNIFVNDSEEMTAVVDNKTKEVISSSYSVGNLCLSFIEEHDTDAAAELPKKMTIESKTSATGKVDKLEKPAEYITLKELGELMGAEE